MTSAVLFVNAGICTFTASAVETILPVVESTENISDEVYFATLSGVFSTEVGAYAGTQLVGYTLDRFYEIGESPIEFQIEDETVAEITQIQGTIVNIKGISTGETTLTANLPNGKTLSIEVIVSEPICTTTTAIFCPYPSYTTTAAVEENTTPTEKQEYYSIYIDKLPTKTVYQIGEELDITGTKIYGSYTDGEFVGDIFSTDLARYPENGMMSLDTSEFDNTKAGTYTIYVHYGTAKASFEVTVLGDAAKLPNGDANGDGDFTIADMVIVQKHIMGKKTAILSDWKAADLYVDGKIDVYDFIVMRENFVKNIK